MHDTDALFRDIQAAEQSGDAARRLAAYDRYLQAAPAAGWAWLNAGDAAQKLGDRRTAESHFHRALATPGFNERHMAHNNLAGLLLGQGQLDSAIEHGQEAVRLAPDYAIGWWCLGVVLMHAGRFSEGLHAFERATTCGAEVPPALILDARRRICRWDGIDALERAVEHDAATHPERTSPWLLFTLIDLDDIAQRRVAEAYTQTQYPTPSVRPKPPECGGRKVRLGYLGSDFYDHATTRLLVETIERHDRTRFEVIGFDTGRQRDDATSQRIRHAFDRCHDLYALSDSEAAAVIVDSEIDILIDLKGYTVGERSGIFALRPAAVQVSYLGWPGTLGAPFIDFIIADRIVAPDPAGFSEKLLYLDCYQPTCRQRQVDPLPSRSALGLPEHALVLGSMNAAWKLTPALFDRWAELLHQHPDAVLWQLADADCSEGLREEARKRGIERQLILAPRVEQPAHIARLAHIDLALDTFPCGGHTTTSDLLWAGAPVLTLRGDNFCGRVAASLVSAAGLPELVASNPTDYLRKAQALLADRARLHALKETLLDAGRHSLLFDNVRYTRQFEQALLSTLDTDKI